MFGSCKALLLNHPELGAFTTADIRLDDTRANIYRNQPMCAPELSLQGAPVYIRRLYVLESYGCPSKPYESNTQTLAVQHRWQGACVYCSDTPWVKYHLLDQDRLSGPVTHHQTKIAFFEFKMAGCLHQPLSLIKLGT